MGCGVCNQLLLLNKCSMYVVVVVFFYILCSLTYFVYIYLQFNLLSCISKLWILHHNKAENNSSCGQINALQYLYLYTITCSFQNMAFSNMIYEEKLIKPDANSMHFLESVKFFCFQLTTGILFHIFFSIFTLYLRMQIRLENIV